MSAIKSDSLVLSDVVVAARDLICNEGDGCVISIYQLLDALSDTFGERFPVSPDTYKVLDLINTLWADPHVEQVPNTGSIEFAWDEKGRTSGPVIGLKALLMGHSPFPPATGDRDACVTRVEAATACINLVRDHGADGVIFPALADKVRAEFGMDIFGDETVLVDGDQPNAVCWNYASREFLTVIRTMLEHSGIRMVRTTTQRYYDCGAPVEIFHDRDGDACIPMPPVEGEIAKGGYATPHWVPTMFVWNGDQS